ncbi:MAG: DNA alkylation repair protein [Planctomycetes bacterium]|nr:DNA alkylation repair protein [Planctomycetota bacterium]
MQLDDRKPARTVREVPPEVKRALERGELETKNLVEWLALSTRELVAHVSDELALDRERLLDAFEPYAELGVMQRLAGAGRALRTVAGATRARVRHFEHLARHKSDVVREFAAAWLADERDLELDVRVDRTRRFAADPHSGVREMAWVALRPHVAADVERALVLLAPWVRDPDENVRRTAIECTRPRGVWTAHLERLKREPELAEPLLDPVHADPSRYVQNAVANWVNDASKTRPEWARALARRWSERSTSPATAYIVRRALRTLARGPAVPARSGAAKASANLPPRTKRAKSPGAPGAPGARAGSPRVDRLHSASRAKPGAKSPAKPGKKLSVKPGAKPAAAKLAAPKRRSR